MAGLFRDAGRNPWDSEILIDQSRFDEKRTGFPARGEKSADIRSDAGNRRFSGALLSGLKRRNRADFERLAGGMLNLEDSVADDGV